MRSRNSVFKFIIPIAAEAPVFRSSRRGIRKQPSKSQAIYFRLYVLLSESLERYWETLYSQSTARARHPEDNGPSEFGLRLENASIILCNYSLMNYSWQIK